MKKNIRIRGVWNRILVLTVTPIIASLLIPVLIMDVWTEIYHRICFPIYKIPLVKRSNYVMVWDRPSLAYLNVVQKIGCAYCGYVNGLMRYWKEIAARTEKYWCPIKHAMNVEFLEAEHQSRLDFAEFGDKDVFKEQYRKS